MAISERTRKIIWARSGNRCAMCRCELVMEATELDRGSVVGEECHIVPRSPRGPRGDADRDDGLIDLEDNLIVLCRVHHKLVDDQRFTYSPGFLCSVKSAHEKWVKEALAPLIGRSAPRRICFLTRCRTGQELMAIVGGTFAFVFTHDEPATSEEADAIAGFSQLVHDWSDLWSDIETGERVKAQWNLTSVIEEIEQMGFCVFAVRDRRKIKAGEIEDVWPIGVFSVVRAGNPAITSVDTLASDLQYH